MIREKEFEARKSTETASLQERAPESTIALKAMNALDFGSVNSETETDLDRLFVRTSDFDKFLQPNVWLVLGAKGTGKSALFELFTKFEDSAREMSGEALDDVVIAAGTGFGDLTEIATGDMKLLKEEAGYDHDRLWRLYIAVKAGMALGDEFKIPKGPLKDLLTAVGKRRDFRIGPLLRELWTLAIGNAPDQVTITAGGANVTLRSGKRSLDVVSLLQDVSMALTEKGKVLWLLFDKIDEIWPADRDERRRSLEGLMTASMEIRRTFPAIQPIVMLRTDLWSELDFTNKDHLTDKRVELNWSKVHLVSLLVKRALKNSEVSIYVNSKLDFDCRALDELTADERLQILKLIFPETVYPGKKEAATIDWIDQRIKDGRNTTLPRDAIVLANFSADFQRELGESGASELVSSESMRKAFAKTSETRCESFLAEFPTLKEHFRRFAGQTRAEFTRDELAELMSGLEPSGESLLDRLFEIGILRPETGRVPTSKSFEIPRLYRTGLGLVIRGRP
jgi:hypothetical protein